MNRFNWWESSNEKAISEEIIREKYSEEVISMCKQILLLTGSPCMTIFLHPDPNLTLRVKNIPKDQILKEAQEIISKFSIEEQQLIEIYYEEEFKND